MSTYQPMKTMKNILYKTLLSISLLLALTATVGATNPNITTARHDYKTLNDGSTLFIEVVAKEGYLKGKPKDAMVFYFGGGWNGGSVEQMRRQAEYFAERGIVSFLVRYRVKNSHKTTPDVSLMDAKSALRYVRSNAKKFNINPDRIIGSGGSAGGHLAAAVTMCPNINDPKDNLKVSSKCNALVLFNPVVCNGPEEYNYGYNRVKAYYKDFSPMHNIRKGETPPMIFMVGSKDQHIPTKMANDFQKMYEKVGGRCDLHIYEGQVHGFFNARYNGGRASVPMTYFIETLKESDKFLQSIGYLKGDDVVERWIDTNYPDYRTVAKKK